MICAPTKPKIIRSPGELTEEEVKNALRTEHISITDHRHPLPRGTANEYHSDADYWWPSENKDAPFVHRDGKTNPTAFAQHRVALRALRRRIGTLALAGSVHLFRHMEMERCLGQQLEIFFLDPKTRMLPHLKFSQGIRGRCEGRSPGIIDGLHFAEIAVALRFCGKVFPTLDLTEARRWFRDYFSFLTSSDWGKTEGKRENNHATAYWLQVGSIAFFLGENEWIDETSNWLENHLYQEQMSVEGFFPAEMKRTKPLGYSIFQVNLLAALHQVLEISGRPQTWHFQLADGRGFRKALEWVAPYMTDPVNWPFEKDVQFSDSWHVAHPALHFGAKALDLSTLYERSATLSPFLESEEAERNMPATFFPLWQS